VVPASIRAQIRSDNTIVVKAQVSASGHVTSANPISSSGDAAGILVKYAVQAARGWRFRPATEGGKPVPSERNITFLFRPSD
jgi:TonB family protein